MSSQEKYVRKSQRKLLLLSLNRWFPSRTSQAFKERDLGALCQEIPIRVNRGAWATIGLKRSTGDL